MALNDATDDLIPEIQQFVTGFDAEQKEYKNKERKMYAGFFNKLSESGGYHNDFQTQQKEKRKRFNALSIEEKFKKVNEMSDSEDEEGAHMDDDDMSYMEKQELALREMYADQQESLLGPKYKERKRKEEENKPNITKTNVTGNFNPDRTEAWGDVELVGGGQGWEFIKATFGRDVYCHPKRLLFAQPELACGEIENDVSGAIALITRGKCSFADKVAFAQQAGAKGVVIINNKENLIRMPAGWMKFKGDILIEIPVVMIRGTAGAALRKVLHREPTLYAQFVAKHWTGDGEYQTGHCAESVLMEEEEVSFDGEVTLNQLELGEEGGRVELIDAGSSGDPTVFEYLLAKFGGPRPLIPRQIALADPFNACTPLKGDKYEGKFVLAKRGGCPFTNKAKIIEDAGGYAAIVMNNAPVLVQMAKGGVADDLVTIPSGMVTSTAGEIIQAALKKNENARLAFTQFDVQARFWDGLKDVKSPQKWPAEQGAREKLFEKLSQIHSPENPTGGRERFEYLKSLYQQATQYWGASV